MTAAHATYPDQQTRANRSHPDCGSSFQCAMVIILGQGQGSVLLGEYFVKASSEGLDDNAFTFSDINSRAVQLGAITLN
jgi:hypothetical protein